MIVMIWTILRVAEVGMALSESADEDLRAARDDDV